MAEEQHVVQYQHSNAIQPVFSLKDDLFADSAILSYCFLLTQQKSEENIIVNSRVKANENDGD